MARDLSRNFDVCPGDTLSGETVSSASSTVMAAGTQNGGNLRSKFGNREPVVDTLLFMTLAQFFFRILARMYSIKHDAY